jgi:hypothetical protein
MQREQKVWPHFGRIIGTSSTSWQASQISAARMLRSSAGTSSGSSAAAHRFAPSSNRAVQTASTGQGGLS